MTSMAIEDGSGTLVANDVEVRTPAVETLLPSTERIQFIFEEIRVA